MNQTLPLWHSILAFPASKESENATERDLSAPPVQGKFLPALANTPYLTSSESDPQILGWPVARSANASLSSSTIFPYHLNVDPFLHESLRAQTVNIGICQEAKEILGTEEEFRLLIENYLETMWQRFPIICRVQFERQLPNIYTDPKADFILLCLAINLIMQIPDLGSSSSMQSSLYVNMKTSIALLEASGFLSIWFLQARLLVCFYEVGHAMDVSASISIAGCGKIVQALGLNKKDFQELTYADDEKLMKSEQEKRAVAAANEPLTLATPSDRRVGPFARECQISYLVGRVLRHAWEPTQDDKFHFEEALQLERTLLTFMPLLIEEGRKKIFFCAALGICTSSLFTLYNSSLTSTPPPSPENRKHLLNSMETCASRIFGFSSVLFAEPEKVDSSIMSPFTAYSQYQAALVMLRFWKETGEVIYRERMEVLRMVLRIFGGRWVGAGRYQRMLDERIAGWGEDDVDRPSFF
ncbi:hypothetical protein HYFRA_00003976 [Hymenoscyphus fraxineus]|uniref:Transcription factor domain-containing protein n=1 Tax=Hymenoscyphus fraxineus TaxID=746836 RepID=A0A9N9PWG7_9HELO|nr:hypothetical protein HYFRA_00003976 [Hymenoscyphus fraxineus]